MNNSLFTYFKQSSLRQSEYTVKAGDTLYKIAGDYGISVDELMNANDLSSTIIVPGQVLVIPKTVPSGAMYFVEYLVKNNDTLSKIASKNKVTVDAIGKYNDLGKLGLLENQLILIPLKYNVYTIDDNDTLNSILKKNNMTLDELIKANASTWLLPGNTIYVK